MLIALLEKVKVQFKLRLVQISRKKSSSKYRTFKLLSSIHKVIVKTKLNNSMKISLRRFKILR